MPNISNYEGYCGTGAPAFIANEELYNTYGVTLDPSLYTFSGYVRLKPNSANIATFTYATEAVDGVATLQLEIADCSAIQPGIYKHVTISTRLADSFVEVLIEGEIVFRPML